ncbi:MAG TPA: hypothetical protein VLJ39_04955, partial [Tepidisphaeraceae bacterium]|nr:hypothetical protein [Tepidisphaeraceae bacterium]
MLLVQQAQGTAITLTASDVSDPNTTSFNGDVGNWSVAGAPSAGNTYSTGAFVLRSPGNGTSYTFGGDSLSIDSGGRFLLKGTGGQVLTVNLILNGGLV